MYIEEITQDKYGDFTVQFTNDPDPSEDSVWYKCTVDYSIMECWFIDEGYTEWTEDYHDPSDPYGHGQRTSYWGFDEMLASGSEYFFFRKFLEQKGLHSTPTK